MSVSTADIERLTSEIRSYESEISRKKAEIERKKSDFEAKKVDLERQEQSANSTLERDLVGIESKKKAAEQKLTAAKAEFARVTAAPKK